MSHKFQVLTADVPRYLDLHSEGKYSLSPDAEQLFEHSHVKVGEHLSNYALPNWEPKQEPITWQQANPKTVERHRKLRRMAIASYNALLLPNETSVWERALKFQKIMETGELSSLEEWFQEVLRDDI